MSMARIILGSLLYVIALFAVLQNAIILAGVAVVVFSILFTPFVFIPAAILVDAYFGAFHHFPVISTTAVAWCALVEVIRPRLFVV